MADIVTSGPDPAAYILDLTVAALPTEGDVLYAAQRQRTRIVERTINGVDVNGAPFEPYSTVGPYYFYPNGRTGTMGPLKKGEAEKRQKRAVNRLLKITTEVGDMRSSFGDDASVGGVKTRSGLGIRFESYADMKQSFGRAVVDLTGINAPHMLQAIITQVRNVATTVIEFVIGIYGEFAGRAIAHNTGYSPRWKSRHQRYFFGASADDKAQMTQDIMERIAARMSRVRGRKS